MKTNWRTRGAHIPIGNVCGDPAKHGTKSGSQTLLGGQELLATFPPKKPAKRVGLKEAYRWVERGYKKCLPFPRQYTGIELFTIMQERGNRDLTHEEVWYPHERHARGGPGGVLRAVAVGGADPAEEPPRGEKVDAGRDACVGLGATKHGSELWVR